jgi:Zn-dependent M28 family amino/carboxypeptidase
MEYFSPDYKDASGRTYPVIKNIIKNAFDRFDVVEGGYSDLIVSIRENETTANLNIWIKGVRKSTPYALIGTEDNPQNINIVLESFMLGGWKILDVEGLD